MFPRPAGFNNDFTAMNWKDTWFFALGAEYALDNRWTLKGGTAFDERSPGLADNDLTWLALGSAHLFYPNSRIDLHQTDRGSALRGNISEVSESATNIFAVQLDSHTT